MFNSTVIYQIFYVISPLPLCGVVLKKKIEFLSSCLSQLALALCTQYIFPCSKINYILSKSSFCSAKFSSIIGPLRHRSSSLFSFFNFRAGTFNSSLSHVCSAACTSFVFCMKVGPTPCIADLAQAFATICYTIPSFNHLASNLLVLPLSCVVITSSVSTTIGL